jgi:RHS repeat-associated protein
MVGKSETTTYVSKAFEVTQNDIGINDRLTQYKHQIYAGDEVVAIQIRTVKNGVKAPDETRYLHKDALGNVDTLTDSHGTVIQRISYDPFGKRTVTVGTDPDLKAWTARGFTGHEHLDNLGLIHMNARLYDPEIGRFISADTVIQAPGMSQSYNRYVYVMNNPLKYTDPSGHSWLSSIWHSITHAVSSMFNWIGKNIATIATIAVAAILGPAGSLVGAMLHGAAAGFVGGLVGTGSLRGALAGAFWGGVGAGLAGFVGHGGAFGYAWSNSSPFGGGWGTALAHGVSQGVLAQLRACVLLLEHPCKPRMASSQLKPSKLVISSYHAMKRQGTPLGNPWYSFSTIKTKSFCVLLSTRHTVAMKP